MPKRSRNSTRPGRPAKPYSQAERVLHLYDRLHRGDILRASVLSKDSGVDRRTLQRDLRVLVGILEERGTPLQRVSEPESGWRLPGDTKRWNITRSQMLAVALGARLSGFLSGKSFATQVAPVLAQLRASLSRGEAADVGDLARKLHVVETGQKLYRKNDAIQKRLATLLDALLLDFPFTVTYRSKNDDGTERRTTMQIRALCMTLYRGAVYFVVEVLSGERHQGERILLALDRIQDVALPQHAKRLPPPRSFDPEEFFTTAFGVRTGRGHHRVQLRISSDYAWAVHERTWHATQVVSLRRDGSLRLQMQLGELREVADWVLGMGEHCKVEGPAELRALVTQRLRDALRQYGATYSVAPPEHDGSRRRTMKHSRKPSP